MGWPSTKETQKIDSVTPPEPNAKLDPKFDDNLGGECHELQCRPIARLQGKSPSPVRLKVLLLQKHILRWLTSGQIWYCSHLLGTQLQVSQ